MSNLELKVNAVMRLVTAEDSISHARAKAEVRALLEQDGQEVQAVQESKPNPKTEHEVRAILTKLGMPEHIRGHRYAVEAIRLCVTQPEMMDVITKGLYPAVATVFDTTTSRVEREIRHAIEVAWERCDYDVLDNYFGCTISINKGKPTNSEFLARVSNIVRERMNGAA